MRVYEVKSSSALHAEWLRDHPMKGLFERVSKKILNFESAYDGDTKPHPHYAVYRRGVSSQNIFGYVRVLNSEDCIRMYARTQNGRASCSDLEDAGDPFIQSSGYFNMRVQDWAGAERALILMERACRERFWLETQSGVFRTSGYNSPHPAARTGPRRSIYAPPSSARRHGFRPGVALAVNAGLEESFRRSLASE